MELAAHALAPLATALTPILLTTAPLGAQAPDGAVAARMRAHTAAFGRNDIPALERFLAPEFRFTSSRGIVLTPGEELAELRAGTFRAHSARIDDVHVQPYGEVAVLTARADLAGVWQGQRYDGAYRITAVWVRRGGAWQLVSEHASRIVP